MNRVQALNRLMLFLIAPFIGILIWLYNVNFSITVPLTTSPVEYTPLELSTFTLEEKLVDVNLTVMNTKSRIDQFQPFYHQSALEATHMLTTISTNKDRPETIYDQRITAKLGRIARHESSDNLDIKLFVLSENKYKGYAMKVKLKSDKAMQLVLAKDTLNETETTLQAARRYEAIAGINAGGFVVNEKNEVNPLETTLINGKYINGFTPNNNDSTFIGLNNKRQLIGGKFTTQTELDGLNPIFGATSGPILLLDGLKNTIPGAAQDSTARAARTVIANYKDDQLLFLVIDGDEKNDQTGATLEELQDKLISLGVENAYNLDGGGSSSLVLNNEMINQPADGKAKPLATHFLFFK